MAIILLLVIALGGLGFGVVYFFLNQPETDKNVATATAANSSDNNQVSTQNNVNFSELFAELGLDNNGGETNASGVFYKDGILVASKTYCLPSDYAPGESWEARSAFESMAEDARNQGIELTAFSTYRDYATQERIYNRYVQADGQAAADRYSAKPGCSEHQTGLAFDIGGPDSSRWAETTFDGTREAVWLEQNAHKYGFIMRYPQGKEHITGYMPESWHYRYIGSQATDIYNSGLTLEEYLGI
ncbi:M15 family metallopeptidase [Culicoidibacter larvae]|uniref:M15 family metallopeptidase n=1 Tax=Culicoidibacter larvae TaxID=2579976 RepID=UPI0018EFA761|nr:M15 family metallopeptidase [Culicoidibacter larvae]